MFIEFAVYITCSNITPEPQGTKCRLGYYNLDTRTMESINTGDLLKAGMHRPVLRLFAMALLPLVAQVAVAQGGSDDFCSGVPFPSELRTAFNAQPDNSKVYLRVDRIQGPSTFLKFNITKLATIFGIRLIFEDTVPDAKVLHIARTLAEILDENQNGRPSNTSLVDVLNQRGTTMVIVETDDKIDELFGGLPITFECFLYITAELADQIKPTQPMESDCPSGRFSSRNNRFGSGGGYYNNRATTTTTPEEADHTVALLSYFIIHSGYPTIFPSNSQQGQKLEKAFKKAVQYKWFETSDPYCSTHCQKMAFQTWALQSAMGADICTCRISEEWKLCTPQEIRQKDPILYGTLTQSISVPDGKYWSSSVVQ